MAANITLSLGYSKLNWCKLGLADTEKVWYKTDFTIWIIGSISIKMPLYELLNPAPLQAIKSNTEDYLRIWNAHDTFVFQSNNKMILISGLIKIYLVI